MKPKHRGSKVQKAWWRNHSYCIMSNNDLYPNRRHKKSSSRIQIATPVGVHTRRLKILSLFSLPNHPRDEDDQWIKGLTLLLGNTFSDARPPARKGILWALWGELVDASGTENPKLDLTAEAAFENEMFNGLHFVITKNAAMQVLLSWRPWRYRLSDVTKNEPVLLVRSECNSCETVPKS